MSSAEEKNIEPPTPVDEDERARIRKERMAELMRKQQAKAAAKAGAVAASVASDAASTTASSSSERNETSIAALKKYLGSDPRAALIAVPKSDLTPDLSTASKHAISLYRAARAGDLIKVKAAHTSYDTDFDTPLSSGTSSKSKPSTTGNFDQSKVDLVFFDAQVGPRGATPLIGAVLTATTTVGTVEGATATSASSGANNSASAAASGALQVVEYLLKSKASPNACDYAGTSPLIVAAARGHAQLVRDLLRANADPTHTDADGWTALAHATNQGYTKIAVDLIRAVGKPSQPTATTSSISSEAKKVEQVM